MSFKKRVFVRDNYQVRSRRCFLNLQGGNVMKTISFSTFILALFLFQTTAFAGNFYIPENSCLRRATDNVLMSINRGTVIVTCDGNQFYVQVNGMVGACRTGAVITPNGDTAPVSLCLQRGGGTQRFVPQQRVYTQRNNRVYHRYRNLESYNTGNGYQIMSMPDDDFREYEYRENWRTDHHTPQMLNNYDQALRINTEYGLGRVQEQVLRSATRGMEQAVYRSIDKLFE